MLTARQTPPSQRVVGRWLVLVDLCEARLLEASCFQSQWSEPREKKKKKNFWAAELQSNVNLNLWTDRRWMLDTPLRSNPAGTDPLWWCTGYIPNSVAGMDTC